MEGQVHELGANHFDRAQRFVVLALDEVSLILAQQEILALEPVLDVGPVPTPMIGPTPIGPTPIGPTSTGPASAGLASTGPASVGGVKKIRAAGALALADRQPCLVYALDSELRCLPQIPPQHRICAIMNHRDEPYALSCKEVRLLPRSALALHDIPRPLTRQKLVTPIKCLAVDDDRLLLGTAASALFAHVARGAEAEVISFDERARRPRP